MVIRKDHLHSIGNQLQILQIEPHIGVLSTFNSSYPRHSSNTTSMKASFTFLLGLLLLSFSLNAQTNVWDFQGYSIGANASGNAICQEAYMPEIHKIGNEYYMYYTAKVSNIDAISYATSSDLVTWNLQDTIITGSSDTLNREYVLGGARVIKTNTGQYRLFYRCAPKYTQGQEPKYHIRSAISTDGIHFTREGVRIEINSQLPGSYFSHVGHSAFFRDQSGNVSALLTGKDTTMTQQQPDKIYRAVSFDEGMTFSGFSVLYDQCHDPVVIKDSTGQYHAYFTYLNTGFRTSSCSDGVAWPSTPDTLYLLQGGNVLTEAGTPGIADLGAAVNSSGTIHLYSNYHAVLGPWTDVARYTSTSIGMADKLEDGVQVFPNPTTKDFALFVPASFAGESIEMMITNGLGQVIHRTHVGIGQNQIHLGEAIPAGMYWIQVVAPDGMKSNVRLLLTQ